MESNVLIWSNVRLFPSFGVSSPCSFSVPEFKQGAAFPLLEGPFCRSRQHNARVSKGNESSARSVGHIERQRNSHELGVQKTYECSWCCCILIIVALHSSTGIEFRMTSIASGVSKLRCPDSRSERLTAANLVVTILTRFSP